MTVSLRPMLEADDSFMRLVFASTRESELAALPDGMASAFIDSQFDLQRRHYVEHFPDASWSVIQLDQRPVGRIVIDRSQHLWTVIDIAVIGSDRGHGIGTTLLTELINEARHVGTGVQLSVSVANHAARRLYSRLGFHIVRDDGAMLLLYVNDSEGEE